MVVDGASVEMCLGHNEQLFFDVVKKLAAVICCRCNPTQKTIIARKLKAYTGFKLAAIGDGGNDVGMLQEADVGIGIAGKEGKQAFLAADYGLTQFQYLSRLLFWHGRLSYKRTATLSQFIIHRGLILTVVQMLFTLTYYYAPIPIFNSYLLLGYTTIYTFLPVLSLVLDQDVDNEGIVIKFPNLYRGLQKGRELSGKTGLIWTCQSLYQGAVLLLCALLLFEESFANIVIINFSALICIELLNLYTELRKPNRLIYLCLLGSFVVYVSSIFIFHNYFDVSFVDSRFVINITISTVIAWLPVHLAKCCWDSCYPPDTTKIEYIGF